jgi:hypothetical protein
MMAWFGADVLKALQPAGSNPRASA